MSATSEEEISIVNIRWFDGLTLALPCRDMLGLRNGSGLVRGLKWARYEVGSGMGQV